MIDSRPHNGEDILTAGANRLCYPDKPWLN